MLFITDLAQSMDFCIQLHMLERTNGQSNKETTFLLRNNTLHSFHVCQHYPNTPVEDLKINRKTEATTLS